MFTEFGDGVVTEFGEGCRMNKNKFRACRAIERLGGSDQYVMMIILIMMMTMMMMMMMIMMMMRRSTSHSPSSRQLPGHEAQGLPGVNTSKMVEDGNSSAIVLRVVTRRVK